MSVGRAGDEAEFPSPILEIGLRTLTKLEWPRLEVLETLELPQEALRAMGRLNYWWLSPMQSPSLQRNHGQQGRGALARELLAFLKKAALAAKQRFQAPRDISAWLRHRPAGRAARSGRRRRLRRRRGAVGGLQDGSGRDAEIAGTGRGGDRAHVSSTILLVRRRRAPPRPPLAPSLLKTRARRSSPRSLRRRRPRTGPSARRRPRHN